MRHVSEQGLALIKEFEGFSSLPYRCPAGYETIGYGHLVGAGEHFPAAGIDSPQALLLLQHDVQRAEQAVCRLITSRLTDGQFAALVSFTYNLGAGALQRSMLRQCVNRGAHQDVPNELRKWVWAGGRKLPGLVKRRNAEARLYGVET